MANGRFMVNCGGVGGGPSPTDGSTDPETFWSDESWLLNPAMKALSEAFPGQVMLLFLISLFVVVSSLFHALHCSAFCSVKLKEIFICYRTIET